MSITIDNDNLRPLIQSVVTETLAAAEQAQAKLPEERLAYTESEAAALIGIASHVLRDARLRGEIVGTKVGKRIVYEQDELIKFLVGNRIE